MCARIAYKSFWITRAECVCGRENTPFFILFTRHILYTRNWTLYILYNFYILYLCALDGWRAGGECIKYISAFFPAVFVPKSGRVWRRFLSVYQIYNDCFFLWFSHKWTRIAAVSPPNSKPLKKTSVHVCPRLLFFVLEFTLSCTDNNHIIASPSRHTYIHIYITQINKQNCRNGDGGSTYTRCT